MVAMCLCIVCTYCKYYKEIRWPVFCVSFLFFLAVSGLARGGVAETSEQSDMRFTGALPADQHSRLCRDGE